MFNFMVVWEVVLCGAAELFPVIFRVFSKLESTVLLQEIFSLLSLRVANSLKNYRLSMMDHVSLVNTAWREGPSMACSTDC